MIGTIEGDIHDIGKGIIVTMLRVHGYEVHDLGRDVPIEEFVKKAQELNAGVVGSSGMMTTTQIGQKKLEEALKEAGLRDKVKVMVGGAPVTGPRMDAGMVFQQYSLFPWRSVLDNVGFGLEVRGVSKPARHARARVRPAGEHGGQLGLAVGARRGHGLGGERNQE